MLCIFRRHPLQSLTFITLPLQIEFKHHRSATLKSNKGYRRENLSSKKSRDPFYRITAIHAEYSLLPSNHSTAIMTLTSNVNSAKFSSIIQTLLLSEFFTTTKIRAEKGDKNRATKTTTKYSKHNHNKTQVYN